ncbi:MAG: HNH endonuclease [Acidobacteriota bacterium]
MASKPSPVVFTPPDLTTCTYDGLALAIKEALTRLLPGLARAARGWLWAEGWCHFGYARVDDHAREVLARSGRWLRDRAVLGAALQRLPALEGAVTGADGGHPLGQVAAMALARFVTADTVEAWIVWSRQVSVRTLKEGIRAARAQGWQSPPGMGGPQMSAGTPRASGSGNAVRVNGASPGDAESTRVDRATPGGAGAARSDSRTAGHAETVRVDDASRGGTAMAAPGTGRCTLGMAMPASVGDLIEDTRDLHSAVCGSPQPLASLVEALVAEAQAGREPVDLDGFVRPSRPRTARGSEIEAQVYDSTGAWSHLPAGPRAEERRTIRLLADVDNLLSVAGSGGAEELQRQLTAFVDLEDGLQRELARILMLLGTARVFHALDFTGVEHYAEERLGLSRTTARDRVAVARSVAEHPDLRRAYEEGRVRFQSALLLLRFWRRDGRHLGADAERAWIQHAGEVTLKRLRDEIRLRSRQESGAERGDAVHPPTAAEWYASLRRAPGDTQARLHAAGRRCGAASATRNVRFSLPSDLAVDFLAVVEARRRRIEQAVSGDGAAARLFSAAAAAVAGVLPADESMAAGESVAVGVGRRVARRTGRVPPWVGLLALLEDYITTWDEPRSVPWRSARRIYERDGWRCAAPGCTSRRHLESHHIVYRSHGGDRKSDDNQVCLCRFHHQQGEHGSRAAVRGVAPLGLVWRLGSPPVGRFFRNECRL